MISPAAFALINLAIYLAILVGIAIVERRGRRSFRTRRGHVRYRRLSSEEMLKMLRKSD